MLTEGFNVVGVPLNAPIIRLCIWWFPASPTAGRGNHISGTLPLLLRAPAAGTIGLEKLMSSSKYGPVPKRLARNCW